MDVSTKNELESVMYSYTINAHKIDAENKLLKETVGQLQHELNKLRQPALMVCEVTEICSKDTAIIKTPNGNKFFVHIAADCEPLKAGDHILAEQKNLSIISKIQNSRRFNVEKFVIIEKPKTTWEEIGGLIDQIIEIKEVIELPLTSPHLFEKVGIQPPKGILLHGPPGTGKTLLAKAVAASTKSTFIEIVGSELVQKFIGEGAKLVKEIFELARQKAPSIVFIDEIDALASRRIEIGTSGEREVQRTFMQLLAELDGFKNLDNVKIIGCTNRLDILDPAIIRPGRLDRLIKVDNPNNEGKEQIFKIHTSKMSLDKKVKIDKIIEKMIEFSGAEIKATCTEAGYFAIRENRTKIMHKDFIDAIDKVKRKETEDENYMRMFG